MISSHQLGLVVEGTIVNLTLAECRHHPELKLYAKLDASVGKKEDIVGQVLDAIVKHWRRGAFEGIELDRGRMLSDVLSELWKP